MRDDFCYGSKRNKNSNNNNLMKERNTNAFILDGISDNTEKKLFHLALLSIQLFLGDKKRKEKEEELCCK